VFKLDVKDRKILYELDLNCRQSNAQIGKKVGLSRDMVGSRIKRMEEEGIIKNYWAAINTFKLGYHVYRIYINFHYVSTQIKKEIIRYFVEHKNTWGVASVGGPIDLDAVIWVKNVYEFYRFWDKTLEMYEEYFEKYTISVYVQAISYAKSYLLNTPTLRMYETTCNGSTVKIDEMDYKILNEIAVNARTPLIELSQKIGCSSQSIKYRMKNLEKSGVIQAYRVNIDRSAVGLQHYKVDIFLRDYKQRRNIIKFLEDNGYIECLNVAAGWSDIEPEIIVENADKLVELIEEISNRFPKSIKKVDYWIGVKMHKERWLPTF
jgi:Lrp/AsnC family leucine-responsive transcriptional regulator